MNNGDVEENPFVHALQSEALNELLKDRSKREMAVQLVDNLKRLSGMFDKLSDQEKQQFTMEFKSQFITQLEGLSEMVKEQKLTHQNSESMRTIPVFGSSEILNEQLDLYLMIAFGLLVLLCVVFFGYKLYLSLTEKERKLQEKQKAKQSKKKK
ncbi:uncharacterized protein LOC134215419 isoform X1 [Armigeres subalbatus]|uniref:uncharacterized protein LOC134215419 isoform X1 n=1 Tax=Armigeres subalbatus TaxID=124917 RepID=UPI002ED6986C